MRTHTRTFILFVAALYICTCSFAQIYDTTPRDYGVTNDITLLALSSGTYDGKTPTGSSQATMQFQDGLLRVKKFVSVYNGVQSASEETFTYNDKGRVITWNYISQDSNGKSDTQKKTYRHIDKGDHIEVMYADSGNEAYMIATYKENEKGIITEITNYNKEGKIYSKKYPKENETIFEFFNGDGDISYTMTILYTADNLVLNSTSSFPKQVYKGMKEVTVYNNMERSYTYGDHDEMIEEVYTNMYDGEVCRPKRDFRKLQEAPLAK